LSRAVLRRKGKNKGPWGGDTTTVLPKETRALALIDGNRKKNQTTDFGDILLAHL